MGCTLFLLAADGTETEVGQAWGGAHRPAYDLTFETFQFIEARRERLICDSGCAPGSHAAALLAAYRDGGPRGPSPDDLLSAAVQQGWPSRLPPSTAVRGWDGSSGMRFFPPDAPPGFAESVLRAELEISPDPSVAGRRLSERGVLPPRGCDPRLVQGWLDFAATRRRLLELLPYLPDDSHLPARDRGLRARLAILTQEIGARQDVYEAVFKDVPR